MFFGLLYDWNKMKESIIAFTCLIILDLTIISFLIGIKLYKGKSYIFTSEEIEIFNKTRFVEKILLSEIESMDYRSFKFRYFITIFFGELIEGGAWKIYVKLKNGDTKILSLFSLKNAKELQNLYGDLVKIF